MRKIFKRIISLTLILTLFLCSNIPVVAVEDEEYLADLRIIYAEDYDEAEEILEDSEFEDYKLLDANLNENTGKSGVWLAYKTTTDIEEAITDIAVMQMNGGYKEGNYQEMIKQSYREYLEFGELYLTAIDYFNTGLDNDHYLTELAYRQLNFYNVVTEGIDDIPDFEGERIGDIFYGGIGVEELATMFMEGNSYALDNIRSLLAMGVSYNADGKTYFEKVGIEAEKYANNPNLYSNENYEEVATIIAAVLTVYRDMFKELALYESQLNYEDEDFTELELQYLEYMSIATLMRNVDYLGGKTLYQFCFDYQINLDDLSQIYPLVAALNEGQLAMTKVNHYYDVVRYSVLMEQSDEVDAKLAELEEKYSDYPFNVYAGVDRTIYRDTFALTSAAYRADAYTESGLASQLWAGSGSFGITMNVIGIVGATIFATGIGLHILNYVNYTKIMNTYDLGLKTFMESWAFGVKLTGVGGEEDLAGNLIDMIYVRDLSDDVMPISMENWGFKEKFEYLEKIMNAENSKSSVWIDDYNTVKENLDYALSKSEAVKDAKEAADDAPGIYAENMNIIYGLYVVGGIMALISAVRAGYAIWNYYHPDYDDIPTALVDLIDTVDGDRYIKYDVVYELEPQDDGTYIAADLNAFEAQRWNALYFTKSYEAGKPLLADEFEVSYRSNVPDDGYMPVHRFGEIICFDLNKYNYNDDQSIYLSVKQSEHNKSAVADVPELIGSVFGTGFIFLAGGLGAIAGIGGTICTQKFVERKKSKAAPKA